MKTQFFNYLRFNRAERNGTFALFLLAFLFFAIPEIARLLRSEHDTDFGAFRQETLEFRKTLENTEKEPAFSLFYFDPNTASFEDFIRLGLNENVSNIICNYREKGGNFRQPADFQKIWSLNKKDYARLLPYIRIGSPEKSTAEKEIEKPVAEPFAFDPNTASEADLLRLGLPARSVKSILNYRNKGGQFRKKEDLEKIYTLGEEDYARIAPFVTLTAPAASAALPVVYAGGYKSPGKQNKVPGPVDINLANMEVWMTLPGIGETRARQLVNYREKLGGFLSVEQLSELRGLPDSVFQNIRPNLVIGTPELRKINLNAASVADLDAHPYISKRQAELIVAYREQHGAYSSPGELNKMGAFSDKAWLAKVKPYLGVE